MTDRIKLAEAMGWGVGSETLPGQYIGVPPGDTRPYGQGNLTALPDPFTDANDCEVLITWLNEQGWEIHVMWPDAARDDLTHRVSFHNFPEKPKRWFGDDWKQGVCELALKVIGEPT